MTRLRVWLRVLMVALAVGIAGLLIAPRFRGVAQRESPHYGRVGEFTLTAHSGKSFGMADLRGAVWLADFVFTRCQGPCPLMTAKMAALERDLPAGPALQFVSVSVDPEYDTPKVLTAYAQSHGITSARWHFLTGKTAAVYDLMQNVFKLPLGQIQDEDPDDIIIPHSQKFVLVDPAGVIRGYYDSDDETELQRLRADVAALLKTIRR